MRGLKSFIAVILWPTLLTCCVSTRTEYRVPELDWPKFPALEVGLDKGNGKVEVTDEWIVRLAEYRIRIEETEKNYNELKRLYEGSSEREER